MMHCFPSQTSYIQTLGINGDFVATPAAALAWPHRQQLLFQVRGFLSVLLLLHKYNFFYMQSLLRPNLYSQEIERHDPDLICLEEVNFGISQPNTSIQCPSSRWTASHSSGTTWTVWVLPGSGCRNLRRHVWSSRWFFVWRRTKVLLPTRIIWALMEMQCSSKEAGIPNILFNKWSFAWFIVNHQYIFAALSSWRVITEYSTLTPKVINSSSRRFDLRTLQDNLVLPPELSSSATLNTGNISSYIMIKIY